MSYCSYRLRSREEGEDAAQTTFLHACRALQRGVVPVAELPWLLAIAKNVCLSRYDASARRGAVEVVRDPQLLADEAGATAADPDLLLGVGEALERLPEQQRRAVVLREWKGLSYREIADELELSMAAVETLIFRARRSLARELEAGPQPSRTRRVGSFLDAGSLLAGIKSLVGGAAAAKVAAAVVATAVVAGAGVSAARHVDRTAPAAPVASVPVSAVVAPGVDLESPLLRDLKRRPDVLGAGAAAVEPATPADRGPAGAGGRTTPADGDPGAPAISEDGAPALLPELSAPDPAAILPDASLPAVPDASLPAVPVPEATLPEASLPDATLPDAGIDVPTLTTSSLPDVPLP